jgi:hypothetical protein
MSQRSPSRSILPLIVVGLGIVLILGSIAWLIMLQSQSEVVEATEPVIEQTTVEVPRVSLVDAKAAYDSGKAVFVDVRGEPYYSQKHIKGALSISLQDLPQRMSELNPLDWIITYCT